MNAHNPQHKSNFEQQAEPSFNVATNDAHPLQNVSNESKSFSENRQHDTSANDHQIAEQEGMGLGGLTGKQPVGEINLRTL